MAFSQMVSNLLHAETKENQTYPPVKPITLRSINPFLLLLTPISSLPLNPSNLHPVPSFLKLLKDLQQSQSKFSISLCAFFCSLHHHPKRLMDSINMDWRCLTVVSTFSIAACSLPGFVSLASTHAQVSFLEHLLPLRSSF